MHAEKLLNTIRTPKKSERLLLSPSYKKGAFDSHAIDCPFLFHHEDRYWMTYVGWDGIGERQMRFWSTWDPKAAWIVAMRINPGSLQKTTGSIISTVPLRPQRMGVSVKLNMLKCEGSLLPQIENKRAGSPYNRSI